jgi:HK97 family phage major capsid protein
MGAIDSVSVGIQPTEHEFDGPVMVVKAAQWDELSLVYRPAFAGAVITKVAASSPDDAEPDTEPTPTEEETNPMSDIDNTVPVEEAAPAVVATAPVPAAPRNFAMPSAAEYVSAFVRGGATWQDFSSKLRAAAPDVVTTDLDGVLPTPIVAPVYNGLRGLRPVVDAIGPKAMPAAGKVFIRPKVSTHTTIGASNGENVALDDGTFVVDDLQVTKGVYGGYVTVSEESIDWSSPEVLGLILDDMARQYAKQTDNVCADNLVSGATNTTNFTVASIADPAEWARWVYVAAEEILSATDYLPTHLFLSPNMWRQLGLLVDTADRPLFPQAGPMNSFGSMSPTGSPAAAFGMTVVVDSNFANDTVIVGQPDGFEIFEQQKGAISTSEASTLSRTLAFRGYLATLMIDAGKFRKAAFV